MSQFLAFPKSLSSFLTWVFILMEVCDVGLVRTAWVAATMPILVAAVPCSGLASFHGAVLGFAKRGKITRSSSQGSLRDHSEQNDEYVIPPGDWFEIVSSPHCLAEMVIYTGLVVASGGTSHNLVSNLVLVAAETH
ncbi:hypothetical protein C1H46_007998 [Malus baccata]|uniref:3-oxo-5-alpha-steroid 4-dehydrogenase C-terminal domain-containing protein n=1 Tax=Malus baccata TaxID=106549 RepID=A0A540N5Q0_MALBA|nr:hypothetical protein C1H46_007998 [Malus baccata]